MLALASCDSYLDKLPDDRAEVNSLDKAKKFLVSAYPNHSPNFVFFISGDNVSDNGVLYNAQPNQMNAYKWQPIETENNDDPKQVWNANYEAAAVANMALEALAGDESADAQALRAEALLCRAFAMFQNANMFCMAWNDSKADEYLGIPYPKVAGESVNERGTLRQTYENINADIEEALPLLNDGYLTVPKYHFNQKAAYAFAARFNLFYQNWDKAIEYATKALGGNPSSLLRDMDSYAPLAGVDDIHNKWIRSGENCNLMFVDAVSLNGRVNRGSSSYKRFCHNRDVITSQTMWAKTPWSESASSAEKNALQEARLMYGSNQAVYIPSLIEDFEIKDKINQTGYAHVVDPVFTGDETILTRAEAYIMKKDYDKALADMNLWVENCISKPTPLTIEAIQEFYGAIDYSYSDAEGLNSTQKKHLNPAFAIDEEGSVQESMLQCVLTMRRIETMPQGIRWFDVKRYGIEIVRRQMDAQGIPAELLDVLGKDDPRRAVQLPSRVISAGMTPNPRNK